MTFYRMKYRPVSFVTLPKDLRWDYVEVPYEKAHLGLYANMPVSKWRYGVFMTTRPLTADELRDYEIEVVEINQERK